jgi:hypothetical protein
MTSSAPSASAASASGAARPSGTALWLLILVMVLVIAPLIALSQVIAYWRVDVVDDQMFAYFGWRIADGATVYLDVWDNKPPAIYWVNAVGMLLGGGSYFGVIAMCVLALLVAHGAFFLVSATNFQRGAAALATILLSFYLTHGFFTGGTNRTETFLVAFELAAVAFYMRGWVRDRWWMWYLAGVLCGGAFLFKQVGLAAWGSMGLHTIVVVLAGRLRVSDGVRRSLLLAGGAASTVLLAAGYLAARGALGEALFAAFGFNRAYFAAGAVKFPYNLVTFHLLKEHVLQILLLPLLMAAAAAIHAFLWWLRPQYRPPEIEKPLQAVRPACPLYFLLFAVWFVVAAYGALMSPHGFRHYVVPTIPPLMLMAGYLINVLRAESSLLQRIQQRAWVLVALIVMAYFGWSAVNQQFTEFSHVWEARIDPWMTGDSRYEPARWEATGAAVAERCGPEDRIQCLGYMPGVYLTARRMNASRFTTTEKIGHVKSHADFVARELEDTLRADPPLLLVMSAEDYYMLHNTFSARPWPTGSDFAQWVDRTYQLIEDIPKFGTVYIFKRRDACGPDDPNLDSHLPLKAPAAAGS